jgi:hypothetical protein
MENVNNILNLETVIPPEMLHVGYKKSKLRIREMMSQSAPVNNPGIEGTGIGGNTGFSQSPLAQKIGSIPGLTDSVGRVAEARLSSSTMRAIRKSKEDVEVSLLVSLLFSL